MTWACTQVRCLPPSPCYSERVPYPDRDRATPPSSPSCSALGRTPRWRRQEGGARCTSLLRMGRCAHEGGREGCTVPHSLTLWGQPAIAEALLEAGARVDAPLSTDGQTPLIRATIHRRPAVIALLLSRGALLSPRDESGMAALDHAEALGRSGCARALRLESLRRTWPVRGGGREGRGGEEGRSAPDGNSRYVAPRGGGGTHTPLPLCCTDASPAQWWRLGARVPAVLGAGAVEAHGCRGSTAGCVVRWRGRGRW